MTERAFRKSFSAVLGPNTQPRYRELVPNPDTVELPGIGHYPQIEAPELVLKAFFELHDLLEAAR